MTGQRPLDFWLRLVDGLLNERVDSALEEHGVTRRQWAMINLLTSGAAGWADLDSALAPFLPPPDQTSSSQEELSELVESGWVSEQDSSYTLTDRGRLVHSRLEAAWARRNQELMRGISGADLANLIGLLERLARNLGWAGDAGTVDTADGLPEEDWNDGQVELVESSGQPAAVIRGTVRTEEISAFLGGAFAEILEVLDRQQHPPAGPPFGRFLPAAGEGFDVVAGFPCSGVIQASGRVEPDALPGGYAARILYRGDYAGVGEAYEVLRAWVEQHGYVSTGPAWESYLDGPEVPEPRTVIQLPCRALDSTSPGDEPGS